MIGAIIGDIIGSVYEMNNIKTKEFPLFRDDCRFTDDTVMTVATADAIMNGATKDDFIDAYKKWGRLYPHAGYGKRFSQWMASDDREPYNSYGNGSAMRVSPCAWMMSCGFAARTGIWPENARELAKLSAEVTHNHPEAIKGALAVTDAIFMCRYYALGYTDDLDNANAPKMSLSEWKNKIREHTEQVHGYDLEKTLDELRPAYRFHSDCQTSVPQAIRAFLESTDFEDAVRNAVSIGGDSDTIAAIAGSIAEAAYGVPDELVKAALRRLDKPLRDVYEKWLAFRIEY